MQALNQNHRFPRTIARENIRWTAAHLWLFSGQISSKHPYTRIIAKIIPKAAGIKQTLEGPV